MKALLSIGFFLVVSQFFTAQNFPYEGEWGSYGQHIVITGNQYGTDNISTEGAFLTTPYNTLSSFSNMFFACFNTNGEREFCSYYGGISTTTSEINPYLDNDGSLYL